MSHRHCRSTRTETGQAAPLLALVCVAIGLSCLGLGRFGGLAVDAATARTAADAAALAGAGSGGEAEARALAEANLGDLTTFERAGADVRVRVTVGAATSSARARISHDGGASEGQGVPAPALRAALARAGDLLGGPVPVAVAGAEGPGLPMLGGVVEAPGWPMHQRGLAFDVASEAAERLAAVAADAGLCRPYPRADPTHFELCPAP